MTVLEPRLTRLDDRVLDLLDGGRALRTRDVARLLGVRRDLLSKPRVSEEDVRLILRGFEHLGYVEQRGGWWRRVR